MLLDGRSGHVCHAVELQYNPERVEVTLETPPDVGPAADPVETIAFLVELDAADDLDSAAREVGIAHRIAAFRALLRPPPSCVDPVVILALGPTRTLPVRVVELSVVEEAFDARLHPIRASLSFRLVAQRSERLAPAAARALRAYDEEQARLAALGGAVDRV
jgi:hypothetical protein